MSVIVYIILGIIILVLLYLVYQYYFSTTTTISSVWLNSATPLPAITTISSPQSSNFSYGVWIYVNTWSQSPKNIFTASASSLPYGFPDLSLDLGTTSPTLTFSINSGASACNPATSATASVVPNVITITNNFPIQTWTYVIVSVNNNICDCYLNGGLVISQQIQGIPSVTCSSNPWKIQFGSGSDIYLSLFQRLTVATDPATAIKMYGNKPTTASSTNVSYGLQAVLTENKVAQTPITIF